MLIALVGLMGAVRFAGLDAVPPGFFVDEAAGAANVICFKQTGAGELGGTWPLFFAAYDSHMGAYFSAPYIYPLVAWTSVFGDGIASFRAFSAAVSVLSLAGLFYLGSAVGDRRTGWLCLLVGALSPLLFQFARIAWDPAILPCLLVWALYFTLRSNRWHDGALGGGLFAFAAYAYPPARAQLALLLPATVWFKYARSGIQVPFAAAFIALLGILSAPLVWLTLTGEIQGRFQLISVFSPDYLQRQYHTANPLYGLVAMAKNMYWHLTPDYLFLRGDNNFRHSTRLTGTLGALEILALVFMLFGAVRTNSRFLKFGVVCLVGYFAADLASAATWDWTPNALRVIGGIPFGVMLAAMVLQEATERSKFANPVILAVAYGFSAYFLWAYFVRYPDQARDGFNTSVRESAEATLPKGQWVRFLAQNHEALPSALHYYLMTLGHQSCRESATHLDNSHRIVW
ncbi:MAG TPA: hypothetical protein VFB13_08160 [Reyranella sp.]|jgi:hypothetical protein|nr:hypothetical protein [Reyranella sp.]